MASTEKIEVFVNVVKGKTVCICKRDAKGCNRQCEKDIVTRDKFAGWEDTFARDKYGKCRNMR